MRNISKKQTIELMCMPKHNGFTLIEMAVVLVITGLLLSAVLSVGNTQIAQSRISTTKAKEASIKTALQTFIARNNRLPCPASTTTAGVEAIAAGVCTFGVNGNVAIGVIPWSSLGMTQENAEDGYYNLFTYAVSTSATSLVANQNTTAGKVSVSAMSGSINTYSDAPTNAATQTNVCATNDCSYVALVMSNGSNAFGAYTRDGSRIALPSGASEAANTDGDNMFVIKDFTVNAANPYDDLILPLGVNDLLTPLTVTGSIEDYNALIQKDFKYLSGAILNYAVTHKAAGSYPIITIGGIYDPWGVAITPVVNVPAITQTTPQAIAYTINVPLPNGSAISRTVYVSDLQAIFQTYGW